MERKQISVSQVRGVDPVDGIVEAIVSVTNIVDNVNDIILPGAYKQTLKKRNPKVVWSHDTNIPVGKTLKVEELLPGDPRLPADLVAKDAGALLVKMQFNLNTSRGRDAYEDVQFFGSEQEWSIGYSVPEGKSITDTKTGIRKIQQLELYEYSPVIFGAAPNTRTLSKDGILIDDAKDELEIVELEGKAVPERYSDLDFSIPSGVKEEAETGLRWASEFGRGGTAVGKNTANYLVGNSEADWKKVFHISAYFARHENEMSLPKNSKPGADGYPGNGLIAWKLWGGDSGRRWSQKLVEAMKKRDEESDVDVVRGPGGRVARVEGKAEVSSAVEKRLRDLVAEHNEKYGDNPAKKVTYASLVAVFSRGVGAYRTNPSSVRPNVTSPEQWAYGRVSGFLYALRNGRFRNKPYDTDLLPEDHPLSSRGEKAVFTDMPSGEPSSFGEPDTLTEGKPYQIIKGAEGCTSGYAIVKVGDTSPIEGGCHETLEEAQAHMTALNIATEGEKSLDGLEGRIDPIQSSLYEALEMVVEEHGKFDQTTGNRGAHYVGAESNPFNEAGMNCGNCVFYEGGGRCEIVEGSVEAGAVCKFWIIPEDLISSDEKMEHTEEEKSLFEEVEAKGAVRSHSTAVNATDAWVDTTMYKRMRSPEDPEYYSKIFAYRNPSKDGTMKTHYSFIHHFVSENGTPGAAAWGAISNSMSVLNGARTGTILRGEERRSVYNHFKRHYDDYGKDAPELKSDQELDEIMMKKGLIDAPLTKEEETNG